MNSEPIREIDLTEKKEFCAIDVAKIIASVLVVLIHVTIFGSTDGAFGNAELLNVIYKSNYISRLAVPFFFVCSGFFLFGKMRNGKIDFKAVMKYIKRILIIYSIWSAVYLPLYLKNELSAGRGLISSLLYYLYSFLFNGSYFHLWYFPALIFGVLIVALLLSKKVRISTVIIIGAVLYVIGLLGQSWYGIARSIEAESSFAAGIAKTYNEIFESTRNGFFDSIVFVAFGAFFAHNKLKISKICALLLFILSMLLLLAEVFILSELDFIKNYDMYLFILPAVFFFFAFIGAIDVKIPREIYKTLRKLSTLIFAVHLLVRSVLAMICSMLGIDFYSLIIVNYVATVAVSAGVGVAVLCLSKRKGFKWLNYIY